MGFLDGKHARDRGADTGAAAGDQGVPAVERPHQTFPVITSGRDLRRCS